MILESALLPFPSEIIMPFSGFVAYKNGDFNSVYIYTFAGVFGNLIGSLIAYYIGLLVRRELIEKYLKYLFIKKDHLAKAEKWFNKYGYLAVFVGRMTPAIRTVISLPAGMFKLNVFLFSILTVIGSIPWNFMLTYIGYVLGEHWSLILKYSTIIDIIAIIALIIFIAYIFDFFKALNKVRSIFSR